MPNIHQSFVKFLMNHAPSAKTTSTNRYPGTPQERVPEGEITQRETGQGIFGNRSCLTRPRLKVALKKDKGKVPGMGVAYTQKERLEFEEKDFSKEKYGTHLTPYEIHKEIKKLKKTSMYSSDLGVKARARKKVKYFGQLRGDEK
ncbi:hypothetical protein KKC63_00710 [Patescibacteria group bacterium]|nr:hypothetical protein [Patescibacteria group bacterium]MBU4023159.1 hypothetical protein [Patescibacteria group bacterium]